jgi:hypothetical protein
MIGDENSRGFGQILPLPLLALPFFGFVEMLIGNVSSYLAFDRLEKSKWLISAIGDKDNETPTVSSVGGRSPSRYISSEEYSP